MISHENNTNAKKVWLIWGDDELQEMIGDLKIHDPNFKQKPYKIIIKELIKFYKEQKERVVA